MSGTLRVIVAGNYTRFGPSGRIPLCVAVTLSAPMNKRTARKIADGLTWARIWSAIPITIVAWLGLKWWVFGLYAAAALTDLLDGKFARRAIPPENDTDFDGKADVVFSVMTLLWIWMLFPWFFPKYWLPYIPILVAIEIYLISMRVRYPDLHVPHFEFGRWAMSLFCFLLPVLLVLGDLPWFVHAVLVIGTASKLQLAWHLATRVKPERNSELAG
jgi:phosphatidylglycerophosphate synthase